MARPIKQGLDYFPLDVSFFEDIKVRRIRKDCGNQAIPILISMLCSIYRDEGYYVGFNSDLTFLMAEQFGVSEGAVADIVQKAVSVAFFDEHMFHTHSILTSKGIQKRFFEAVTRRKEVFYDATFMLISVNDYNNLVNVDNNSINDDRSTQSKVKESKVKESKVKESKERKDMSGKPDDTSSLYKPIVDYLNQKAGTSYKSTTKKTQSLIKARLAEGYGSKDFFEVIDKKAYEWVGTDMEKYLRPETLFGNKFEGYLNARVTPRTKGEQIRQNIQSPDIQEWLHEEGGIF